MYMMENTATTSQRIAAALKRNGVTVIFGQSNPTGITLAATDLGIRQVGYRQENAGSYMVQAHAMCTQRASVVTAQNGPAATLLVPGLAECLKASHPVVAIVQDVGQDNVERNAFQELDHVKLFEGVAKWVRRVPRQDRIEEFVDQAFIAATSGRPGPSVLLVPMNMVKDREAYPVPYERRGDYGRYPLDRTAADPARIKEAAALLAKAKQPIIYAGGGVISSQAQQELRALQEQCGLPVATSTMGKGSVDETHPLSMGPIGYYMGKRGVSRFMKPLVDNADVILLVGNRTNQNGTDDWKLLPRTAQYIHIDIDPMENSRNYEALRIVGDAKLALGQLLEALQAAGLDTRKAARPAAEAAIAKAKADHKADAKDATESSQNPFRIERFMAELDRQLPGDAIIAPDASLSSVWVANYITARQDRKFIFPRGIAGLGWGLPYAMGAKVAQPNRQVFCLAGDGGFAHMWSELETCKREGIDVVVAVINNAILGYQMFAEEAGLGRSSNATTLTVVDHAKVAEACGVKGIRVTKAEDIAGALQEAFATKGTVLLDLLVEPKCIPPIPMMGVLEDVIK
ncbi:MAG: acetolactate synthase catalytic subunit [Ruminococcaceae bacterium]|nr:acetolactate synthase catalytic subunit [Oscillospiraceae bacterium]